MKRLLTLDNPLLNLTARYIFDWSYHPTLRAGISSVLMASALGMRVFAPSRAFKTLLTAHRLVKSGFWADLELHIIRAWLPWWHSTGTRLLEHQPVTEEGLRLLRCRSLVLKPANESTGEKGVFLIKGHFAEAIASFDIGRLLETYRLVLEPGSAGYAFAPILYFTGFPEHPVVVFAPYGGDRRFLEMLSSNLVAISLGASDWVNPNVFRPLPGVSKIYDAVMVAYWGRVKRHHVLFRAIRALRDKKFRVALVGFPWDEGTRTQVEQLASWYGVSEQVTFFERLPPEQVNLVLNQSKVNLLLSLKEGANRTLFEGMFADIPAILLQQNIGVNKEHIIDGVTGQLVSERDLPKALLWFREHYHEFRPRQWALRHISPEASTAKLNSLLKEIALERGEPWTRDIVAKTNCPDPMYYPDPSVAEGFPTVENLLQHYGRART
ncbi:MAG: glycosyltransferase [Armatimonadota bacterium]